MIYFDREPLTGLSRTALFLVLINVGMLFAVLSQTESYLRIFLANGEVSCAYVQHKVSYFLYFSCEW